MSHSRAKSINLFHHCSNPLQSHHQPYHTFRPNKPKTTNPRRRERLHRDTTKLRKPIPFVSDVKEIQDPEEAFLLCSSLKARSQPEFRRRLRCSRPRPRSKHSLFSDAGEIFARCSKLGFRPNSISYNIMIKGWLQKGEWE
ncbi:hypothetical protein ACFX15_006091 [Malus domestica]